MQEFIEKLIGRLEELEVQAYAKTDGGATYQTYRNVIEMVIQLAEEHKQQLSNDLEIISSLPSLYALQPFEEKAVHRVVASVKNNGWIPCSERLPNKEEYLKDDGRLIVTDGSRRYQSIFDIYSQKFCTSVFTTFGSYKYQEDRCVIAWQPLPAPYQPKGE